MKTRSIAGAKGIGPEQPIETTTLNVAIDNLVCGICGQPLESRVRFAVISHPKRKGILILACMRDIVKATEWLGETLGVKTRLPKDSTFNPPSSN